MLKTNKTGRRLKVLVSVYACDPEFGSEPGMGANWVIHLARWHDLWILTEEDNYAPAMRRYLDDHPELRDHIHVVGIPRLRFGEGLVWHLYYLTYRLWQREAYRVAGELHRKVQFDLVHQLNMIGYREPGYLWQLPLPMVWGPIGGHAQMPWRFLSSLGWRGGLHYGLRNILNGLQMRWSQRVRRAMRRADVLAAATGEDQAAIRRFHGREAVLINEQGTLPTGGRTEPKQWDGRRPLKLVWCGLHLARKALHLALEAIALIHADMPVELHIVGTGPCESRWKALAVRLGIGGVCHWHGHLPHDQALAVIASADLMLFTGLQEGTPATVMEAIQAGVPVICHDACGFGAVVNAACGMKIPMHSPADSVRGFADALLDIQKEPDLVRRLSEGALARAVEIAWENRVGEMLKLYERAMAACPREVSPARPD